jgi:GntR family transcriptional regulator
VSRAAAGPALLAGPRRTALDRQPKYLRIHAELRDRISSGRWAAGHPLPAQRELAAGFGVSVMTLRQALQLLADDGLIDIRHGSGSYVAQRYAYDLGHLRSFAADLAGQGAQISTRLLAAGIVTAPDEVDARLGGPGDVLRLRRLRLAAGRPLIVQTSYLPAELTRADGPGADSPGRLDVDELAERGLYTVLAEHGLAVTRATETITPVLLGPADAADLGRPAGRPALLSHRVSFTAAGLPIVDDHAVLPGDSVAISANRSAEHLEVQYTLATR